MDWKKILLGMLIIPMMLEIYSQQPIVGYPTVINNQINISNPNSYAIYEINIYNPTNYTYYYDISPLSSQWFFIIGENNTLVSGYLYPGQLEEIEIYMRPLGFINQIPEIVVYLHNLNITSEYYSDIIQFTPVLYYSQPIVTNSTTVLPLSINFELSSSTASQNSFIYLIGIINNPNNFSQYLSINISSDFNFSAFYNETLSPGVNIYQFPIFISNNVSIGEHHLIIYSNNQTYYLNFTVFQLNTTPIIEITKNGLEYIINITNPYNYPINYTYYLKSYYGIFSTFYPNQYYTGNINGTKYAIYNVFLLPGQSYIIYENFNYLLLAEIIASALLILFIIFYIFLRDNVEISKEILRIDLDKETIDVTINIKNKSIFPLNQVKLIDRVNGPLKVKEYKIVEPSSVYKVDNNYSLNWKFDNIRRNEEIVISYTLEAKDIKEYKNIELPRAELRYKYLIWDRVKYSNGLIIRITK
jgi:hypothetical protein